LSLFAHGFGRGIKGKRTMKGLSIHPPPNPKEKGLKIAPRKLTKKEKWERHIQALRNHAESSIHTKEVYTRSSLPPDHYSLSQDLTMKL
jgi:hypothetical protein